MGLKNVISEAVSPVLRRGMIVAFLTGWVTSAFTKDSLKTYKSIFNLTPRDQSYSRTKVGRYLGQRDLVFAPGATEFDHSKREDVNYECGLDIFTMSDPRSLF